MGNDMEIREMPVGEIIPYENNPRKNEQAVAAVAESIKQCGYVAPIIVDENNVILAGHTRLKAVMSLGGAQIPVIVRHGLTDEQKRKYRILDNKTSEFAEWDFDLLETELDGLDFDGFDFGFDDDTEEYPGVDELDADMEQDEKTVVRLVFQDFKSYSRYEIEIKDFAESIGASVTVGK